MSSIGVGLGRRSKRAYSACGKDYQAALSGATGVILASESAPALLEDVEEFLTAVRAGMAPKLRRVVVLSHIGVERRDVEPWKLMNRKLMVGTGVIGGKPKPGGAPLDRWWDAEEAVRAAAAAETSGQEQGWTYTIVRVVGSRIPPRGEWDREGDSYRDGDERGANSRYPYQPLTTPAMNRTM